MIVIGVIGRIAVGLVSLRANRVFDYLLTVHFGCLSVAVTELFEVERGLLLKQMVQSVQVGELHAIDMGVGCVFGGIDMGGAFKNSRW